MPRPLVIFAFFAVILLVGCASSSGRSSIPLQQQLSTDERCAALTSVPGAQLGNNVVITTAVAHGASDAVAPAPGSPFGGAPAMPAHCEVVGKANEREGAHGQVYAIGFRMRLPEDWNGRFLFQGGGGTDGNLGDAIGGVGAGLPSALDRGFAVISTDAGHDNQTNSDPARQGAVAFGFDYEARLDYAERSLEVVSDIGRSLISAFYHKPPESSYFFGCSNGGRQGPCPAHLSFSRSSPSYSSPGVRRHPADRAYRFSNS